ncbi:MAG: glycoside hydrolase family 95 protein [Pseudomonadota bacterium]
MRAAERPIARRQLLGWLSAAGTAIGLGVPPSTARAFSPNPNLLWYRAPAREWVEALPVGNGRIGAMVFGGVGTERLQLNEDSFWSGGPYDPVNPEALENLPEVRRRLFAGEYAAAEALANAKLMAKPLQQAAYQSIGSLMIEFTNAGDAVESYRRSLDIDRAIAETEFAAGGARWRREVLACPLRQVIAVRLSTDCKGGLDATLSFRSEAPQATAVAGTSELLLTGRNGTHGGRPGSLSFAARMAVSTTGGSTAAEGDRLSIRGAREVLLLIAMATSCKGPEDVSGDPLAATAATLAAARGVSFSTIARDSAAAHRRLFRRVTLDLGTTASAELPTDERIRASATSDDPALAALYFQYGRYLLIASSRPGAQPANLQGLWNESASPPWGSKYTININTEMNYWPAHATNLAECAEPLIAMVRDIAVSGARTAREMYGARGWVTHHNTDLWRATAPIDGAQWGLWPTGGAWLCLTLWQHYEYDPEPAYLASIYPILAGSARFFLDTLQIGPGGHLVTNPSLSPENVHPGGASLMWGPTMDTQILTDLFINTAAAARTLGRDDGFVAELDSARARLSPMRIGAQGQLMEWPIDWDAAAPEPQHRHVSHLYGLYPSHQIDLERTPALAAAARKSLELRGDLTTGWAIAWRLNLWARLRDGNRAHRILKLLLAPSRTYPNMFDAHPPFQIDGNFGGAAAIAEMLVQSDGDIIHLLPALPDAWSEGEVTGLRTRGGCTVDVSWQHGRLKRARITANRAVTRSVRYNGGQASVRIGTMRTRLLRAKDIERPE